MSSATEWAVLGVEPVPGDPAGMAAVAEALLGAAREGMGAAESVTGLARIAADGWSGATATAFAAAVSALGPEVGQMVEAATGAASVVRGFAEDMRRMRATAEDLCRVATVADADRTAATDRLRELQAALQDQAAAVEQLEAAWRAADARADEALATGAAEAAALQAAAAQARLARNDARAAQERTAAEVAGAEADLEDAEERLSQARADAQQLAEECAARAAATAAALQPVSPYAGGRFGAATAAVAPPPPQAAPRPVAVAVAPRPPGAAPTRPAPPPAPLPAAPSEGGAAGDGGAAIPAADVVRVASVLAGVRLAGGAPVPVAAATPTRAEFERFRRMGLQAVTARGAAIARALGFDGTIGGLGWRPTPTDHSKGLAIDLMTYDDVATGEALAAFFREHHDELGVTYVIWNGQICSARGDWAWRPYTHPAGRTDATAMHLDHVHVSFDPDDNAYACACFGVDP